MFLQANSSNNNLLNCVYGGRPVNELPHVRKSPKKRQKKVDLILRVDLVRVFTNIYYT